MHRLFAAFEQAGKDLFLVGGAVRDMVRGMPEHEVDDLDFCTNARPDEILEIVRRAIARGEEMTTYDEGGTEFGTIGVVLYGDEAQGYPKDCQITTYRSEEHYQRDDRRPEVEFGDTIDQDLGRRDLSINSIAMDADRNYVDPYHGREDIEARLLRVIVAPGKDPLEGTIERLIEDPLRILRVARFMSKLGYMPTPELTAGCKQTVGRLETISHERWFIEMTKLLCGEHVRAGLEFSRHVGALDVILPEVTALEHNAWQHTLDVLEHTPAKAGPRWGALLHEVAARVEDPSALVAEIAKRYRYDNELKREVRAIAVHYNASLAYTRACTDADVRRWVREVEEHGPFVDTILVMGRAQRLAERAPPEELELLEELGARIAALEEANELRPDLPTRSGGLAGAGLSTDG
ncbi:MAG: hypothetical protein AAGI01_18540, partial [Myxococcota bacterium]